MSSGPFRWRADSGGQQWLQLWPPRRLWLRLADGHRAQTQTGEECENPCVRLYDTRQTEGVGEDRCTHVAALLVNYGIWSLLSLINKEVFNLFHWRHWSHVANVLLQMVPNRPSLWFVFLFWNFNVQLHSRLCNLGVYFLYTRVCVCFNTPSHVSTAENCVWSQCYHLWGNHGLHR